MAARFRRVRDAALADRPRTPENLADSFNEAWRKASVDVDDFPLCLFTVAEWAPLVLWPERFPDTPWTEIPPDERRGRLIGTEDRKRLAGLRRRELKAEQKRARASRTTFKELSFQEFAEALTIEQGHGTEAEKAVLAWDKLKRLSTLWDGPTGEIVIFRVDWRANHRGTQDDIRDDILRWCSPKRRPKHLPPWQPPGGEHELKFLARMRIVHAMPVAEAENRNDLSEILRGQSCKNSGARTAVKRIMADRFNPWFERIQAGTLDETPLHYGTWAERNREAKLVS